MTNNLFFQNFKSFLNVFQINEELSFCHLFNIFRLRVLSKLMRLVSSNWVWRLVKSGWTLMVRKFHIKSQNSRKLTVLLPFLKQRKDDSSKTIIKFELHSSKNQSHKITSIILMQHSKEWIEYQFYPKQLFRWSCWCPFKQIEVDMIMINEVNLLEMEFFVTFYIYFHFFVSDVCYVIRMIWNNFG